MKMHISQFSSEYFTDAAAFSFLCAPHDLFQSIRSKHSSGASAYAFTVLEIMGSCLKDSKILFSFFCEKRKKNVWKA